MRVCSTLAFFSVPSSLSFSFFSRNCWRESSVRTKSFSFFFCDGSTFEGLGFGGFVACFSLEEGNLISGRSNFVGLGSSTFGGFGSSTLGSSSFGGFGRSTFGGFDGSNLGGFGKLDFGVDSFGGGGGSLGGVGSFSSTGWVAFPVTFD